MKTWSHHVLSSTNVGSMRGRRAFICKSLPRLSDDGASCFPYYHLHIMVTSCAVYDLSFPKQNEGHPAGPDVWSVLDTVDLGGLLGKPVESLGPRIQLGASVLVGLSASVSSSRAAFVPCLRFVSCRIRRFVQGSLRSGGWDEGREPRGIHRELLGCLR
jgi:hypothetical protein